MGLRWWFSSWASACQCRGHQFDLWSWKIPNATGQLSQCTTTTEICSRAGDAQLLSPYATTTEACVPQSLCSTRDATTMRNLPPQLESSPSSQQLAKVCTQQQRPSAAKNKYFLSDLWVINTHGIFFSIFSL